MKFLSKQLPFGRLEIIGFIVGMAILMFELTAARIVAPYLGTTIYTWTSIIGVILAALAAGYAKGGILADRRQKSSDIILALLAAAVLITIVNLSKDTLLAAVVSIDAPLQVQSFLASISLFALPTFLLGLTAPYLARLSIRTVSTSGQHLSRIDAAGTLGSLTGTFLTGYILFGLIGSRNILTLIALGLIGASFLVTDRRYRRRQWLVLSFVLLATVAVPKLQLAGIVAERDTAYSRVIVRDLQFGGRPIRTYQTDAKGLQSGKYTDGSNDQPFSYIRSFDYFSDLKPSAQRYLIIGGGAFTFPESLARKMPNATIDTVEIDRQLPDISRQYFGFQQPANLRIISADGRVFLNQNTTRYGMIFLDAFGTTGPPFQLITTEALSKAAAALDDDGIMITNVISAVSGDKAGLIRSVAATFASQFTQVNIYRVQPVDPTKKQNLVIVASKLPLDQNRLQSLTASNLEFATVINSRLSLSDPAPTILTDDFSNLEQLAL